VDGTSVQYSIISSEVDGSRSSGGTIH
jgi:hypothetical protein